MPYKPKAVTKETLAYVVGELLELPHLHRTGQAYKIVQTICKTIVEALQRGESVRVVGLGIFKVRVKKATRAPTYYFKSKHCEIANIPPKTYIYFQPAKDILRTLNGN